MYRSPLYRVPLTPVSHAPPILFPRTSNISEHLPFKVWSVAYSADGQRLVAGVDDGSLIFFDTLEPIRSAAFGSVDMDVMDVA